MKPQTKKIFTVKDRALDIYNLPFTMNTAAQAVRSFTDEINGDKTRSQVAQHPDDYDLYIIGEYDEQTAAVLPLQPIEMIVRGKDLIRAQGE